MDSSLALRMTKEKELTQIGVIVAAHGIRGQVKIKHFLDNPKSILSTADVVSHDGKRQFKLKINSVSQDILIATIDGVTDRNTAELLKRTELFIAKSALPETKGDSWYYNDLIGLEARLKNGQAYGEVVAVQNFGAGDIVEVKKPNGELEMFPFNEQFVGDVKADKGFLVVIPPEYTGGEKHDD
jgi:16S rRNA processing protein RimM